MTFAGEATEYRRLVTGLLPLPDEASGWRFSRPLSAEEPEQGWKLHVSATVRNARVVLERCARYLLDRNVAFKACGTLEMLAELNCGFQHGFSQVGKFITVYPSSSSVSLELAAELDRLTDGLVAPRVPYDLPYRPGSLVHYRYGAFARIEMVMEDGSTALGLRDPAGKLWVDNRSPGAAVPVWIQNPFPPFVEEVDPASPLLTDFLAFEALSQRGKGGVYRALDMRNLPARECIVKEGRPAGEEDVSGKDGRFYVQREAVALAGLAAHVPVPRLLASFDVDGHSYIAMERIEGDSLMAHCSDPRHKIPLPEADTIAARIARTVQQIHAAGWVWRDCKPLNLMLTDSAEIRPIDFEGATLAEVPSAEAWGTPGYLAPEVGRDYEPSSNVPEDLFALGATLHQLFSSTVPVRALEDGKREFLGHRPIGKLRKGMSPRTRALIAALLAPVAADRPTASEAVAVLAEREGAPVATRSARGRMSRDLRVEPLPDVGPPRDVPRLPLLEPAGAA